MIYFYKHRLQNLKNKSKKKNSIKDIIRANKRAMNDQYKNFPIIKKKKSIGIFLWSQSLAHKPKDVSSNYKFRTWHHINKHTNDSYKQQPKKRKVREQSSGIRCINTSMVEIERRHNKDLTISHVHLNKLKILQCDTLFLVKWIHHIHIFLIQKMLAARPITPWIPNKNTNANEERKKDPWRGKERLSILMRWCPEIGSHVSSEIR